MRREQPSVSIIVMADRHPEELRACLRHLGGLATAPDEVVVVPDDAASRQAGVERTTGQIVVFLDATSRVEPDWLDELLAPYQDSAVVGVGGRVLYGEHDGGDERLGETGCLLPNGRLTTNFGADPGRPVQVDHLPSAQASFRREALQQLGSIPSRYPGRSYREVTETSLRLSAAGGRLIFQPAALVRAPALRFPPGMDLLRIREGYFHDRDQVVVLVQAVGWRSPLVPRFAWTTLRAQQDQLRLFADRVRSRGPRAEKRAADRFLETVKPLVWVAAELTGVAAGFPAAAAAAQGQRRRARDPTDAG